MLFRTIALLALSAMLLECSPQTKEPAVASVSAPSLDWIDTVHYDNSSKLNHEQSNEVFFIRHNEENYQKLTDTARIALRFSWYRALHPTVTVRVENRPEIYDSSGVRKVYQEWFALYKEDIVRLNHDCPIRKGDKCYGKPFPFVHQQQVVVLTANKIPSIVQKLDAIGFWKMKPVYSRGPHGDGSNWNLEVYYKGRYKQVSIDLPVHPVKDVCLEMLNLTGKKLDPKEIY